MSPGHHRRQTSSTEPSEERLREMLVEAERRRDAELHRNSRTITLTLIFVIPTIAASAWVANGFIQKQADAKPVAVRPVTPRPPTQVVEPENIAELDQFRPKSMRGATPGQPIGIPKEAGKWVDKGDIGFVMQLMNFCQPPAKKEDGKK